MLYGYPPFTARSRQITRTKIIQWRSTLHFPSTPSISSQARHFMERLICDREDRLGSTPSDVDSTPRDHSGEGLGTKIGMRGDGADQIRAHPWFQSLLFFFFFSLFDSYIYIYFL